MYRQFICILIPFLPENLQIRFLINHKGSVHYEIFITKYVKQVYIEIYINWAHRHLMVMPSGKNDLADAKSF